MGSKRAQDHAASGSSTAGVPEADLTRISAPVGLDLGALSSEEVALSIMAEVVAVATDGPAAGFAIAAAGRSITRRPDVREFAPRTPFEEEWR